MKIKLFEGGKLPIRATAGAACYDVFAREIIKESDDFYIVNIGFAATPPKGYKLCLVPRSSITKTHWLIQNSPGQGDEDFFHEYSLRFRAIPTDIDNQKKIVTSMGFYMGKGLSYPEFPFKVGDRVGQIFKQKVEEINFEIVDEINQTTDRVGGFGSTNKL